MTKPIETINITPAPMSIENAIELYDMLADEGKADFIECFHIDDQDVLRKALVEAGKIIYECGGLHTIIGKCIDTEPVSDTDPFGNYTIETEHRTYNITLNLGLGDEYIPPNAYPKVGDRVVVKAEGIEADPDSDHYIGYAEICHVATDAWNEQDLATANSVIEISA